jgi:hypothetical protein
MTFDGRPMDRFTLPRSALTPSVVLDAAEHLLEIEGECYPEDPRAFFAPLLDAIERYAQATPGCELAAKFRLGYVNSAAVMGFRRVFVRLDEMARSGKPVRGFWEYDADDDTALELFADLAHALHAIDLVERSIAA